MKKSKSSRPRDGLSELPDSLIFHIFWFLPMTDVVKTTVLSNRWKNLWTTSPYLNFDCDDDEDSIRTSVNRALLSWRGSKIQKFKIDINCNYQRPLFSDFDLWVRFAVDKNVEELYVHRNKMNSEVYLVPQYLFSCSSLKVLSLEGCDLKFIGNANVQWNHLRSLTIEGVRLDGYEHVFNQVLCGSPQLEVLVLAFCENKENLSIRSSSLKMLLIDSYILSGSQSKDRPYMELKIWTPNLETLEISGVPYSKYLLLDVSSLTDATLGFKRFFNKDIDLWEILRPILLTIQNVERVTLSNWCIKLIGDAKRKHLLPPFPNVKFLKLDESCVEYEQIVVLLEVFPKLKMLVLQDESKVRRRRKIDPTSLKFEVNLPKSFLQQLRTVEITWAQSDNLIFPFIEILLKHASNLEKMVIRVIRVQGNMPSSDSLILASQKLLGMPRSSPNCRVSLL